MEATNRVFTEIRTGEEFRLFTDRENHKREYRSEKDGRVANFIYSTAISTEIRLSTGEIIEMHPQTLIERRGTETHTRTRYSGQKRFRKP